MPATDDDSTPDELMETFRGRSLKTIIAFTIAVHAIVLLGTSIPFLAKSVMGRDTSALSEEERLDLAVREATESLREIADQHGLNPQDISTQFTPGRRTSDTIPANPEPGGPDTAGAPDATATPPAQPTPPPGDGPDVETDAPQVPDVTDDEDLFE